MNDPIDRQAAIDAMKSISDSICEQQAIDALCELPSAQPDIIHCRDCTYYQTRQKSNFLPMCCLMSVIRDADDYCSKAERRKK